MPDFHEIASSLGVDRDTESMIASLLEDADAKIQPEKLLRNAALLLNKVKPSLSRFDALKEIHRAFKKGCRLEHRYFSFTPEASIELPSDIPPCPAPDPCYHLFYPSENKEYRKDIDMLEELAKIRDEELPDAAVLPIIKCFSASFRRFEDAGSGENMFPDRILERYGARAFPCIMRILADPERYTFEPYKVDRIRLIMLEFVRKFPEALAFQVFRAVFRSGWNKKFSSNINSLVPNGRIKATLVNEFWDSPYGRTNLGEACCVKFDKNTFNISRGGEEVLSNVIKSFTHYPSWVNLMIESFAPNALIASGQARTMTELLVDRYKVDPHRIQTRHKVSERGADVVVAIWPDEAIP